MHTYTYVHMHTYPRQSAIFLFLKNKTKPATPTFGRRPWHFCFRPGEPHPDPQYDEKRLGEPPCRLWCNPFVRGRKAQLGAAGSTLRAGPRKVAVKGKVGMDRSREKKRKKTKTKQNYTAARKSSRRAQTRTPEAGGPCKNEQTTPCPRSRRRHARERVRRHPSRQ